MKRKTNYSVIAVLFGVGFSVSLVFAQPEIERLYLGGFYDQVIETADSCLQQKLTTAELETYHQYKAFAYVALGENGKAKEEFKIILLLDPARKLDPSLVSPKIIEVFEQAKNEMPVATTHELPRPLPVQKRNLSLLFFPGIYQLASGEKAKGSLFLSFEIAAVSGLAVSQVATLNTHNDYLKAREPDDIEKKYSDYKKWFSIRSGCAGCALGMYLVNIVDGLLSKPRPTKTGFYLQPSFSGLDLGYCW
jgi:tetratricopeptide (TPR) repeat protein